MEAVILAGGKGARLQPYTALFPKPLMPLGDISVLDLLLYQVRAAGVTDVYLAVNHLHQLIRAYCGDGSRFGLSIQYSLETSPLGTAGPLGALIDNLGDNFFVANGDLLTSFDIEKFIESHLESGYSASVAVHSYESKIGFGVLQTDVNMHLIEYHEKPANHHLVSMGMYMLKRSAVRPYLKPDVYLDMPDLLKMLIRDGKCVHCHPQENVCWLDIGRPDDYALAQEMFHNKRNMFLKVQDEQIGTFR